MATLHLDGSANGSILLDLHAGGLARPSLFIIHIALFPDSMLILAPWPPPSGQHTHTHTLIQTPLHAWQSAQWDIFIWGQFGVQTRSVLFLATRALLSFPQKINIIVNKSGNCYMGTMMMSHLFHIGSGFQINVITIRNWQLWQEADWLMFR